MKELGGLLGKGLLLILTSAARVRKLPAINTPTSPFTHALGMIHCDLTTPGFLIMPGRTTAIV
ncbi:MAG TPA: hypothetical protein DD706_17130 [Nitrospiraceae bacterium]|nr:hypothetical protein [Nitrospiraceae bacterium]